MRKYTDDGYTGYGWLFALLVIILVTVCPVLILFLEGSRVQESPQEQPLAPISTNQWQLTGPGQLVFQSYGSYDIGCSACYLLAQTTNNCWHEVDDYMVEPELMVSTSLGLQQGTSFRYSTDSLSIDEMVIFRAVPKPYAYYNHDVMQGMCEPNGTLTLVVDRGAVADVTFIPNNLVSP